MLEETEKDVEEASALLGASRLRTVCRVVLPQVFPALLTGIALAFARGIGEYGSVIFIAGNIPMVSEIAPLLIVIRLEEFEPFGASLPKEAFELADRVAILNQGQIERVGTPKEIIEGPATDFIDDFVDEANAAKYDVVAAQHVVAFKERQRFVSRWEACRRLYQSR